MSTKTSQQSRLVVDLSLELALPKELGNLPTWFGEPLGRYLRSKQRNWPSKTVRRSTTQLFQRMLYMSKYFIQEHGWEDWTALSTRWLDDYIDYRIREGIAPSTINWDLNYFCQLCNFLAEDGYSISSAVLRLKRLDVPKRLPRPLPGNDVFVLEQCIQEAQTGDPRWNHDLKAIRDLASFYLLWHCGLRVSEVCALMLQDVDFENGKLFISNSKERKDRVIYMSPVSLQALKAHLEAFPPKESNYVFEFNGQEMRIRNIQRALKMYGKRCGVSVSPHRLRHTFASQMLNAGMPVTSLQRYLGHENVDTTMGYAEISDPVLQREYNQAIQKVDPFWELDECSAKMKRAQQRIQILTTSLQQARQNAESYMATLEEIQNLIDELRQSMS